MSVKISDCRWGKQLYLSNDVYFAPLLERYGDYNWPEVDLFRQFVRPDDTVVDVGANIGCHTASLANIVGMGGLVLAFEPQRVVYNCLCGTLALNGMWQVNTYLCALGAERGMTKVPMIDYDSPQSFGGVSVGGLVGNDVPVVPLDDFNLPSLKFLKIDVEGYEREVLLGAEETIRRCRPFVYVENDRKDRSAALIELLRGWEYRLWLHAAALYHPDNFNGCDKNLFPGVAAIMLLGIPAEMPVGEISLKPIESDDDMIKIGPQKITGEMRAAVAR
jgi:FkbM family methyltransferase